MVTHLGDPRRHNDGRDTHTELTEGTLPEMEVAAPVTRKALQAQARAEGSTAAASFPASSGASAQVSRVSSGEEPLLLLLLGAVYKEAIAPLLRLPVRGTRTLKRLPAAFASGKVKRWLSIDDLARRWYDERFSEPLMFLPSDLPEHLIDRKVTHVHLDGNSPFKYIEQYDVLEELGEGSTGKVLQVQDSVSGELYAVKVLNKKMLREMRFGDHNLLKNVETEIKAMRLLGDHPNLLKLHEVMDAGDSILLRIEYCGGGQTMGFDPHLFSRMTTWFPPASTTGGVTLAIPPLDEHTARCYFSDLIAGLEYLHQQNMVHRDIKPENLLLTCRGRVKIADFGTAIPFPRPGDDRITEAAGTPAFQSPEAVAALGGGGPFSGQANDVWACGVTLFVFVHGHVPFLSQTASQTYQRICSSNVRVSDDLALPLRDLLYKLLDRNPATRLKMDDIKKHPWMLNCA